MTTQLPPAHAPLNRRDGLVSRLADPVFNVVTVGILLLAAVAIIYPLYFIVIASVSDPNLIAQGKVWLLPQGFTMEGYETLFRNDALLRGVVNSLLYTSVGTLVSVSIILCTGYALSRKDMPGRNLFMILFIITMFFDGGMIARYLVVRDLGLLNTMWAVILPGAVGVWNLIIARTFFQTNVPDELREAAQIDGANDFRFFFRVALPLTKPLIALMAMTHIVAYWNSYFDAMIYLNDEAMYPLQLVLRNVLVQSQASASLDTGSIDSYAAAQRLGELIKYGMIVVSTVPLLIIFPFLQKYFVKGATLGALK
ncbi:carbohydrate ABC transporter permease [Tessaracoccus oleiagri]|uniref:Putative aldouronate transport system permease protein n=1 Tax=Tessaracoccus oleiagri TaxID=686624 RepID=A0A1G9I2M3_9ACTN|nr:carbohydrate ABC transporter permease [Tessaracoccus oleiagri]SDL19306.1 putative aldouronate transport system permease protein [Tessaracoccus oleiagri]